AAAADGDRDAGPDDRHVHGRGARVDQQSHPSRSGDGVQGVAMAVIEARELVKTYAQGGADMRALNAVSIDVNPGELMLLVGPSGSGKTTLLSVVGCILRPTSGSLRVLGDEVTTLHERDLPAIRRERIGFVFQGFNLFPTLTALQNVALAF